MVNTYTYKNVVWVDLESPTRDEVREIMQKYDIHPLAAEELLLPTTRSKVDKYPEFIYLILHFPATKLSHQERRQEIDFIVGKNYIITSRYDTIDPLLKFAKMFEVNSILAHNGLIGENAGYMFYYMMREIYHSVFDELESIKDALEDIEKKTFSGDERAMVYEISDTSRDLLAFKHSLALHKDVLESFDEASKSFFGHEFVHYMEATKSEYLKIDKTIQGLSESLAEMRETNSALLEAKQNRSIMTLTAITFITSVLGVPIAIFEINFKYAPVIGIHNDFWVFSGAMATLGLAFAAILVHKKWL